jgi:DNA-directed RNA polymerase subunit RPC12/RpoP
MTLEVCSICGNKSYLVAGPTCGVCGREGCVYCNNSIPEEYLERIKSLALKNRSLAKIIQESLKNFDLWICSQQCFANIPSKFVESMTEQVNYLRHNVWYQPIDIDLQSISKHWIEVLRRVFPHVSNRNLIALAYYYSKEKEYNDYVKSGTLALAEYLEEVGRYLDAANIYERQLKMYDKARELRTGDRQLTIKKMSVSVDLNELLRQIRDGGIVAIYKCPNCGGKLKVGKDSTVEKMRTCEHCGNEIQTADLAEFLKDILS